MITLKGWICGRRHPVLSVGTGFKTAGIIAIDKSRFKILNDDIATADFLSRGTTGSTHIHAIHAGSH